jgi:hypothetical protein
MARQQMTTATPTTGGETWSEPWTKPGTATPDATR